MGPWPCEKHGERSLRINGLVASSSNLSAALALAGSTLVCAPPSLWCLISPLVNHVDTVHSALAVWARVFAAEPHVHAVVVVEMPALRNRRVLSDPKSTHADRAARICDLCRIIRGHRPQLDLYQSPFVWLHYNRRAGLGTSAWPPAGPRKLRFLASQGSRRSPNRIPGSQL